jgi:hypothetical protein
MIDVFADPSRAAADLEEVFPVPQKDESPKVKEVLPVPQEDESPKVKEVLHVPHEDESPKVTADSPQTRTSSKKQITPKPKKSPITRSNRSPVRS